MLFTCPNASCAKKYEIDPAQIPAGKAGFKCQSCGVLVPVKVPKTTDSPTTTVDDQFVYQPKVTYQSTFSPALLGFLIIGIFLVVGSMVYFYMQYTAITNSGIVLTENLSNQNAQDRAALLESVRTRAP